MLQATRLLVCDHCSSATDRCERGWRAYPALNARRDNALEIYCPECAEQLFGEDEPPLY
jgi:DNA-directed RNA polymerase subunit RPC12/RpoP